MTKPTKLNYVTCEFGRKGPWAAGYHTGIDYRAPVGTRIYCTRGGKVIHAGRGGWGPDYGIHVIVESRHKGKKIRHLYAHLQSTNVRVGQRVYSATLLGYSGLTGNVKGPHLHYEERVAPFNYGAHKRPVLPQWKPSWRTNKAINKKIK